MPVDDVVWNTSSHHEKIQMKMKAPQFLIRHENRAWVRGANWVAKCSPNAIFINSSRPDVTLNLPRLKNSTSFEAEMRSGSRVLWIYKRLQPFAPAQTPFFPNPRILYFVLFHGSKLTPSSNCDRMSRTWVQVLPRSASNLSLLIRCSSPMGEKWILYAEYYIIISHRICSLYQHT